MKEVNNETVIAFTVSDNAVATGEISNSIIFDTIVSPQAITLIFIHSIRTTLKL